MDFDKDSNTATWLKFFKDAGLPTKTGASYALIFAENRINKDMLSDLTVDYLRLMGITLMGDIIAILRHSKTVHQDSLRKVVILQSKEAPKKVSSESSSSSSESSSSSSSSSSSDDDVEMVETVKSLPKKIPFKSVVKENHSKKSIFEVKQEKSEKSDLSQRGVKSKIIGKISSGTAREIKTQLQSVKRKYTDEENEKSNYIDLPSEAKTIPAPSTRSVLKTAVSTVKKLKTVEENAVMGPKLPPPKKTVFERLGNENDLPQVSSTTELPKPIEVVETKFTRTISSVSLPIKTVRMIVEDEDTESSPPFHKLSSVFDRLGGLDPKTNKGEAKGPALQYAGVFKSPPTVVRKPVTNMIKKVGTMRADEPEIPVKLRAASKPVASSNIKIRLGDSPLKNRLKLPIKLNRSGLLNTKPKIESEGIFANTRKSSNVSVRERLGLTSQLERSSLATNKGLKRAWSPVTMKNQGNKYVPQSRNGISRLKTVSFGLVEEKLISPLRSQKINRIQGRPTNLRPKTDVHSRLGAVKY